MVGSFGESKRPPAPQEARTEADARPDLYQIGSWCAVALGVLFYLLHFAGRRSFWIDEVMLGLNLKYLTLSELAGKLDYAQVAPIGWLYMQKGIFALTHDFELGLRLTSLAAMTAALVLFRNFVFQALGRPGALAATALFACAGTLVRYAAEFKPYAVDVLLVVVIMAVATRLLRSDRFDRGAAVMLAIAGFGCVLLSFAAVYALAVCTGLVILQRALRGRWGEAALLSAVSLAWLAVFGWLYLTVYHTQVSGSDLVVGGSNAFFTRTAYAPLPPKSLADLKWYAGWGEDFLTFAVGRDSMFAAAVLILVGLVYLARRSPWLLAMIVGTLAVAMIGSGLRLYPLFDRLALFLAPGLILAMGAGAQLIVERSKGALIGAVVLCLLAGAASGPSLAGALGANPPFGKHHARPLVAKLAREIAPGDLVYVSNMAIPAFLLYGSPQGLTARPWIAGALGERSLACVADRFAAATPGASVWLLYVDGNGPEKWPASLASDRGLKGRLTLEGAEAGAWLYRLRVTEAASLPPPARPEPCVDASDRQKLDASPRLLARTAKGG